MIEPQPVPEEILPSRGPTLLGPSVFTGPDLFNPPATQGWMTIAPSFTLSAEYNDNLGFVPRDKISDVVFGFTPGGTLSIQRPRYRLLAGYNIEGEVFLQESQLNDFGNRQEFFADAFYQLTPRVTITLADRFILSQDSSDVTTSGRSSGRGETWRNTLTPRLRWQVTPKTAFNALASWTLLRFQGSGTEQDSDTYRAGVGMDHQFTPRLAGTLDFNVAYLDFENDPGAFTYTPRVGVSYDVTKTLRASVGAGPTFIEREGDTDVRPSVTAGVLQLFKFGSVRLGYERSVVAETDGISDLQTFFASLVVPTLRRGLLLSFTPRYSIADTHFAESGRSSEQTDIITLNLRATYQIARNISLIGSYTFHHESRDPGAVDIDENRVFLGLQYAFPINFY